MTPVPSTLAGKRLVLLRGEKQGDESEAILEKKGALVIRCPLIEFAPPTDRARFVRSVAAMGDYAWIAFTSPNGVFACIDELRRTGRDARAFEGIHVAAIGPGTANTLRQAGVRADFIPTVHEGEAFARELSQALPAPVTILLLRAEKAREVFPDTLRAAGHLVDVVPAYQTVPAPSHNRARALDAIRAGEADAILFTSASTVEQFFAAAGAEALTLLGSLSVASIGPITSAALRSHGVDLLVEAKEHSISGLFEVLESHFALPRSRH